MICNICKVNNPDGSRFCSNCGHSLDGDASLQTAEITAELPMVGFGEAVGRAFSNYFNFSGRATRAEYWWWVLATQGLQLLALIPFVGGILALLLWVVCVIPGLSVAVRRLHDLGKTGWWLLGMIGAYMGATAAFLVGLGIAFSDEANEGSGLIALAISGTLGGGIMLVAMALWFIWFIRKGDLGPNKYGPDPRQVYGREL